MDIFLKNKNYRRFTIASLLSTAGDILFYLALYTYASDLKNYTLALSLITISESVPRLLSSLGGYLADRTANKLQKTVWLAMLRGGLYLLVGVLFCQNIAGWNLVAMVIVINFISDTAGIYSSGLVTPLVISLVDEDQVAAAEGFTSGVSQLITMIAQFTGSGLLLFMSYSALAFVNGLTFILAGLIYLHLLSSGHEKGTAKAKEEVNDQNFMATLALAFRQVKKAKGLLTVVMVIALLNGILSTIEPLLAIVVASHRQTMVLGTYSFTLALLGVCAASGMALGGIVGTKIFKHLSLYVVVLLATIAASCVIIAASSEKIILCLLTYGLLGFFSGIASPKLTQWMVTTVDRKILASTIGLLNTILVVVGPLMTTVFTTIAAASSVTYALLALLVTNLAVLVVTLVVMSRTTKKS